MFKSKKSLIITMLKKYRASLLIIFFILIVSFILTLFMPVMMQKLIDKGVMKKNLEYIFRYILILSSLYVFESIIRYFNGIIANSVFFKVNNDLKYLLTKFIMNLPVDFLNKTKSGNLISIINNDSQRFSMMINQITVIIFDIIVASAVLIILFFYSYILALIVSFSVLMYFILSKNSMKKTQKLMTEQLICQQKMQGFLVETFTGIKTIKVFSKINRFLNNFKNLLDEFYKVAFKTGVVGNLAGRITLFISNITPVLILGVGSFLIVKGEMTIGELFAFYAFIGMLFNPMNNILQRSLIISEGKAALNRIYDFLKNETEQYNGVVKINFKDNISFENVYFLYENNRGIKNISFKINKNETFGIIGNSGSGKSTIVKLLIGLIKPQKGTILIDNYNLNDIDINYYRNNIGVVSQDIFLFNDTLRNNIIFGIEKDIPDNEIYKIIELCGLNEFMLKLENKLDTNVGNIGSMLSGGEKQRISLARALIKNPEILILDEPASGIDKVTKEIILNNLKNLKNNMTIIIISHQKSEILLCDRIMVLNNGIVDSIGTHEELYLKNEFYKKFIN